MPQMINVEDEPVARGAPMIGNLETRTCREPDNGYGLRLSGWIGYSVNAKRVGSVSPWEENGGKEVQRILARIDGWSERSRGRHRRHQGPLAIMMVTIDANEFKCLLCCF